MVWIALTLKRRLPVHPAFSVGLDLVGWASSTALAIILLLGAGTFWNDDPNFSSCMITGNDLPDGQYREDAVCVARLESQWNKAVNLQLAGGSFCILLA